MREVARVYFTTIIYYNTVAYVSRHNLMVACDKNEKTNDSTELDCVAGGNRLIGSTEAMTLKEWTS